MLETIGVTSKHEQVLTKKAVYTIVEKVPSNGDDILFSAALIVSNKLLTERDNTVLTEFLIKTKIL